ncbi:MAG TPA: UDP-N-acetylglucosamine 2-epimerase (non-hydrolyzing) [Lacunisphaera sp.]|jgi:UDP-N-acetylglucosamine 2-epimerase (non-hydrolysing)
MRVLSIIGTRPEALKMGPVACALARTPGVESLLCTTGQHRELLQSALALFRLKPDFNLTIHRLSPDPTALLAVIVAKLGPLVQQVKPDWILAVGDTTSVLCASLVATHHHVRFGHIEAGLRTDSKWEPFPEEANRRIVSVLADLHFAPTSRAQKNLRRENIPAKRIIVTGNPVIDTLRQFSALSSAAPSPRLLRWSDGLGANQKPARLVVVTFHRRENIGRPMREICAALRDLVRIYGDTIHILCLIHPNPAVKHVTRANLNAVPNVVLSPPVDYPAMIAILKQAYLVLTDSGGLQEEAPSLRVPVLVLRNRTERPEGVRAGAVALVGTSRAGIVAAARRLLDDPIAHRRMSRGFTGYGDGHAAERIVAALSRRANTARM